MLLKQKFVSTLLQYKLQKEGWYDINGHFKFYCYFGCTYGGFIICVEGGGGMSIVYFSLAFFGVFFPSSPSLIP